MQIHQLEAPRGSRKKKRIVGRGPGSGRGKTSGRGENGQRSRAGRWTGGSKGSEGGQMRLIRRLPKVGFRSHRPREYQVVNVESLNKFDNNAVVNIVSLKSLGLIGSVNKPFKILGKGELKKSLTVQGEAVSKTAAEKINSAGGKIETPVKNTEGSKEQQ